MEENGGKWRKIERNGGNYVEIRGKRVRHVREMSKVG
jgi:predicted transcriptional regulator